MKKWLSVFLSLSLALALAGCNSSTTPAVEGSTSAQPQSSAEPATESEPHTLMIGASSYSVTIPGSYVNGDVTEKQAKDGMIAYYYSKATAMDFDVYEFSKKGYPDKLKAFVEQEAKEYNGTDITTATINDIPVISYRSVESYEGTEYNVITYAIDDGDEYVEIAFWLDGSNAEAEATEIIKSLETTTNQSIKLGKSSYSITAPKSYVNGDVTEEQAKDDMVAYYYSEATAMDFDVYEFAKKGYPDKLKAFVEQEAKEYDGTEITAATINDIPVISYRSVESYEGVKYNVVTYAMEDGDNYVEIAFWLDGSTATLQADKIIATLTK